MSETGKQSSTDAKEMGLAVLSPPSLVRCVTDSPSHYFLRGNHQHRWSSTPLIKAPGLGRSVSSIPTYQSTPMLTPISSSSALGETSPSNDSQVSSLSQLGAGEFQKRLDNLGSACQEADSGIGSSLQSSEASSLHSSEAEDASSLLSPEAAKATTAAGAENEEDIAEPGDGPGRKLRRSPRHKQQLAAVSTRLDRCTRLLRDKVKTRLQTTSAAAVLAAATPPPAGGHYLERERLDMLRLLSERGMWHVTGLVLAYLEPADLCAVALVSIQWKLCLVRSEKHEARRVAYVEEKKRDRENFGLTSIRTRTSPRLALQEVNRNLSPSQKRNRGESTSSGALTSPAKIRNRLFEDTPPAESKRLHCPNCSASSPVTPTQDGKGRGTCSAKSCGLVFCAACFYSEHPGQACRVAGTSSRSRSSVVSSKKSKARLRRL